MPGTIIRYLLRCAHARCMACAPPAGGQQACPSLPKCAEHTQDVPVPSGDSCFLILRYTFTLLFTQLSSLLQEHEMRTLLCQSHRVLEFKLLCLRWMGQKQSGLAWRARPECGRRAKELSRPCTRPSVEVREPEGGRLCGFLWQIFFLFYFFF